MKRERSSFTSSSVASGGKAANIERTLMLPKGGE
jgi:hypothetical protein